VHLHYKFAEMFAVCMRTVKEFQLLESGECIASQTPYGVFALSPTSSPFWLCNTKWPWWM